MTALTVMILTFNEERHIARAIDSVATIGVELVVIDSYSTDRTVEIARAMGATILQNRFVTQARQFQWGLDHFPVRDTLDHAARCRRDRRAGNSRPRSRGSFRNFRQAWWASSCGGVMCGWVGGCGMAGGTR